MIKGDDIPLDPFLKGIIKGSLRGIPSGMIRGV